MTNNTDKNITINIDDNTLDLLSSSSESLQFNNPNEALSLYQTLYHNKDSILSCLTINDKIFVGCQSGTIQVWDNKTLLKLGTLFGHTGAILCLTLSKDGQKLYSGSSDDTVRVWCTKSLQPLYIIHTRTNVGDILSIVSSPIDNTIYIGCQNTSIQKFNLEEYLQIQSPHIKRKLVPNPSLKGQTSGDEEGFDVADYFFNKCNIKGSTKLKLKDKIKDGEIKIDKDEEDNNGSGSEDVNTENSKVIPEFVIPSEWIYPHCHFGYIYSLTIGAIPEDPDNEYLFSGSGDGDIKIWKICPQTKHLILFSTLQNEKINNIYSLVIREDYLICGSQGGNILVFDLDTFSKFRTLIGHKDDVLSLCLYRDELFSASADGAIKRWNANLDVVENKVGHEGMILALAVNDQGLLLSGGSDHMLKLWWVQPTRPNSISLSYIASEDIDCIGQNNNNGFIKLLNKFVSIPTISGNPKFQQDCMRGARFLKNLFLTLGAESKLVHGADSRNPLVLAKFKSNKKRPGFGSNFNTPKTSSQSSSLNFDSSTKNNLEVKTPHVLFYGHYDVIPVDETQWNYPPFSVTGANGYLYGRGVTDNKGPILATIFAIAELYQAKELDIDVTLVIEGEEESGSIGFYEAIKKHKNWIGKPDVILLSNSYWIGEDIPCVTYGLRGKINASIQVSNPRPDAHSGFYGGVIGEPLIDLTRIISKLVTEDHKVNIPGFYDNVRPVSNKEDNYYINLASIIDSSQSEAIKSKLQSQWRFPTLTLHRIVSSGPNDHSSVISSNCKADISMRIVPDQKLEEITKQFINHVKHLFSELRSDNEVNIEINQTSNWWIGNPDNNDYFDLLWDCITKEWGKSPLLIREGGSIPTVPWLEDFFKCPAIHFPMGQSSDQAHLKNERIRLRNLQAGKNIIRNFFINLSSINNKRSNELSREKVFEPQSNNSNEDYLVNDNGSSRANLLIINNNLLNIDTESDADSLNKFKLSDIEDI